LKDATRAERVANRLAKLQTRSGDWKTERSTPFNGWGRAGDIETTGIAVHALERAQSVGVRGLERTIKAGIGSLLSAKDEGGAWSSTQATIQALLALTHFEGPTSWPSTSSVAVNGAPPIRVEFSTAFATRDMEITPHLRIAQSRSHVPTRHRRAC
jgi:hypothetical protein